MPEYLKKNEKTGQNETNRLMDIYVEGINAEAKVLKIEEAGAYAGRQYYKFSLEVKPSHTKKFKITGYAPVSGSLIPKSGDVINIKYNSTDTEKFVII
jgi:hypothetical protein